MIRFYLKEIQVDAPNISVRLNKKVTDAKDFTTKSGNYSFTVDLPITKDTRVLLENIQELQGINKFLPGNRIDSEITTDGATLIRGDFVITKISKSVISGYIIGEDINWLSLFGDLTLRDLDEWNIPYTGFGGYIAGATEPILNPVTDYNISYYNTRSSDIVDVNIPLIFYGRVFNHGTQADNSIAVTFLNSTKEIIANDIRTTNGGFYINQNSDIDVNQLVPAPYYFKVLERCFKKIGLNIYSDIIEGGEFRNIIVPFTGETVPSLNYGLLDTHRRVQTLDTSKISFAPQSDTTDINNLMRAGWSSDFYYKPANVWVETPAPNYRNFYFVPRKANYNFEFKLPFFIAQTAYQKVVRLVTSPSAPIATIENKYNDVLFLVVKLDENNNVPEGVINRGWLYLDNEIYTKSAADTLFNVDPRIVGYVDFRGATGTTTSVTPIASDNLSANLTNYAKIIDGSAKTCTIAFDGLTVNIASGLEKSDKIAFVQVVRRDDFYSPSTINNIQGIELYNRYCEITVTNTSDPVLFDVVKNLPNIKIKDFIKDLITNMNLNINFQKDKNLVSLPTAEVFYNYDNQVDITPYLASDDIQISNYLDNSIFSFSHKPDATDYNLGFNTDLGKYEIQYYNSDSEKFNISSLYSATVFEGYDILYKPTSALGIQTTINFKHPVLFDKSAFDKKTGDTSNLSWNYKHNYRLLLVTPTLITNNSVGYQSGIYNTITEGVFIGGINPYCNWTSVGYIKKHFIGSYQQFRVLKFDNVLSFSGNSGLFIKNYNKYINEIVRTHKVVAQVNLPTFIYNQIQSNTIIKLETDLYKLIEIQGFDPSNNNSATITLIKII